MRSDCFELAAMAIVAVFSGRKHVTAKQIASITGCAKNKAPQRLGNLYARGLLIRVFGVDGGYSLGRPAQEILISELAPENWFCLSKGRACADKCLIGELAQERLELVTLHDLQRALRPKLKQRGYM